MLFPARSGLAGAGREHDLGGEHAVLMGEGTGTLGAFGDSADGLNADAVSGLLCGKEYAVFS